MTIPETPTGSELHCKSWQTEAPLRMFLNNLDEEVAEDPENLVVYGGTGKAARNKQSVRDIIDSLKHLDEDETLLVQSGKPVGVFPTHEKAPRVLIANSLLVPDWANWEHFHELEQKGLMMYGQMTAGSWIYIGTQGILQGTYETFAAAARKHFDGSLKGKLLVTAGLGGMGGAQPLAATMNHASFLGIEVDRRRMERRVETGYLDEIEEDLDRALEKVLTARENEEAYSVGLVGNASEVLPELVNRDIVPDVLTDQTSAHDELNGYIPAGLSVEEAEELRESDPEEYKERAFQSMATHVRAMLELQDRGAVTFDYGNNLRGQAKKAGVENAFDFPGFVPAYIRPMFCEGRGPFRWAALSGDPEDIYRTDELVLDLFPEDDVLQRWIRLAQDQVQFQGLPSRICWLGYGARAKLGKEINRLVRTGELNAPVVIGRDHLDCGSVASPNRETEGMKDGSDAIADWPILNALLNTSSGATWVSVHHGGGVGMGLSIHAGQVICADGTDMAEQKLERVLNNDPGIGVVRHADAGYEKAKDMCDQYQLGLPDQSS